MINFKEDGQFYIIYYKNRIIFKTEQSKPMIMLGKGTATYKMNRGSFKIKEKAIKDKYYYQSHQLNNSDYLSVKLVGSNNYRAELEFKVKENRLHIKAITPTSVYNRLYLKLWSQQEERIYGCGEQFVKFNLKGEKVKIWVSEHITFSSIIDKAVRKKLKLASKIKKFEKYATYMAQPTFITSNKVFAHLDTQDYSAFDFSDPDYIGIEVGGIPEQLIIAVEDDYEKLLVNLTDLLGRQPELPEWIYNGLILAVQGGTALCSKKAAAMKKAGLKIAGIWSQDWSGQKVTAFGKQVFWDWSWDQELYPGLDQQIKEWGKDNIAFLGYINPFLAIDGNLYQEASAQGYLVKNRAGGDYIVKVTTFPAAMIDLTNPAACRWIKSVIKQNMIKLGLKGWMADFGEYLPTDAVLYSGENAAHLHNQWPVLWAKVNREAIEEAEQIGEIVFFTRAGFTGTSKYSPLMWNGDQHVDWSRDYGIGSVINSQLSLSVCGLGLSHSDIGGYTTWGALKRNKELLLRWTEIAAFSPVMRLHEGNRPESNWQFDDDQETIDHIIRFTNIYTQLKPYIRAAVKVNSEQGIPVIKPLFFYYEQAECYDLDDSYLLGRDLLVSPVLTEGKNEKRVILPDDDWVHLWTGKNYNKGEYTIPAPIGQPPVFYRLGSEWKELFASIK